MSADRVTFGLTPATRPGGPLPGGGYRTHRAYLDFLVDGRPLLPLLDDLDAVSPLAADVGPTVFTVHVRRLLLEGEPPLSGGRYVVYGCPECEGLECGAVTAVIEQLPAEGGGGADGGEPDVVWRDFAWQTGATVDLARDGYHGVGPFRFRAAQYRSVLGELLHSPQAQDRRRVLLIGRRAAVLARLAAALRQSGIGTETTHSAAGIPAEELRGYGVVAFGRAVEAQERSATRAAFAAAGADTVFVDGYAPVVPVLVAQIEQALDRADPGLGRLTSLTTEEGAAVLHTAGPCGVRLTAYRLDRLYRTHERELLDTTLEAGTHRIPLDRRAAAGRTFLVARTAAGVQVVPVD